MLSKFSVKKPFTVLVGVAIVILLGIVSFGELTVDLLPSMNLPYALVITTYPGASPEEVEEVVARPVEQAMATTSNIKNVSSTSAENYSTVILEFEDSANMDAATIEMRESLDQIKAMWPEEVGNPIISKINPDMLPIMITAASVTGADSVEATNRIQREVIPEIESIEGVASVEMAGNVGKSIDVVLDDAKIEALEDDVRASLDNRFAEAERALAEAKAQVEEGKASLEAGQSQAIEGFSQAEAQITRGDAEMTQGLLEINARLQEISLAEMALSTQLTASRTLDEQEKQINDSIAQAEEMQAELEEIQKAIEAGGGVPSEEQQRRMLEIQTALSMAGQNETLQAQIAQGRAGLGGTTQELEAQAAQLAAAKE